MRRARKRRRSGRRLFAYDRGLGARFVAGADEAGRGCLAGPLVAEAGLRFRNKVESGPGGQQVQIEDPDGNPIELFEPAR